MPATPPTCLSKMSSIHHSILTVLSIYYDGLTPREVNVADSETAMYSGLSNTTDSTHKVEQSSNPMLRNQATKGGSLTIDTSPYRDVKTAENRSSHSPSGIVGVPTRKMSVYCDNVDSIPPLKIDRGFISRTTMYVCMYVIYLSNTDDSTSTASRPLTYVCICMKCSTHNTINVCNTVHVCNVFRCLRQTRPVTKAH